MSKCARCGAAFTCSAEEGEKDECWCMRMPPVPLDRLAEYEGCLCPACLQKMLSRDFPAR